MKNAFLLSLLLVACFTAFCQSTDPIEIKKSWGTHYLQNGKNLMPRDLLKITQPNAAAYQEMKIAKRNYNAGIIIGSVGGALVGWPLGTALAGGDPNWALAGIGAGLIVISIPLSSAYNNHATKAVHLYNDDLKKSTTSRVDIKIQPWGAGLKLQINF